MFEEEYEGLPKYQPMKLALKRPKYWDVYPLPFKPKKMNPYIREWYWQKGQKPHSQPWGRKPYWRKKRQEQRRAKWEEKELWECIRASDSEVM